MEREIKFRARDLIHNQWIYGGIAVDRKGNTVILPKSDWSKGGCVYESTIGQYTGLQDKNGKDIYEGDILMCIGNRRDNKGKKYYRSVLFKHGSFCMTAPEYNCLSQLYNHVVNGKLLWEIVGNIYDNKDLLEESYE